MRKEACPLIFNTQEDQMVVGEITVSTCYGDVVIAVEILGKGPRPGTAWVKALGGLEPFTKMSHGGPYQDDAAVWPTHHLRNVHIEKREAQKEVEARPEPAPDWFLEMAYEDRNYID
jgi:hypothetical protein